MREDAERAIDSYMRVMAFSHLVDPPRIIEGGVLFTMNAHALQRTVCIVDAALQLLAPAAITAREKLRYVMEHIEPLSDIAVHKASGAQMPELIVIDVSDVSVAAAPSG